jgi:dephospho-CoA kinase
MMEYAIALTGGISTGKSTVCSVLRLMGFKIIDADSVAHEVLEEQHSALINHFGESCIANGKVNRKFIGNIVFNDAEEKKWLEALVHPLIREKILSQAKRSETQQIPYFIDIPLFFETKAYPIKRSLLIYATKELQLDRLIKRDGFSAEEAQARIDSQMSIDEKRELATDIIENCEDVGTLMMKLEDYRRKIHADYEIQR